MFPHYAGAASGFDGVFLLQTDDLPLFLPVNGFSIIGAAPSQCKGTAILALNIQKTTTIGCSALLPSRNVSFPTTSALSLWNFVRSAAVNLCNQLKWPVNRARRPIGNHLSTSYSQLMLIYPIPGNRAAKKSEIWDAAFMQVLD